MLQVTASSNQGGTMPKQKVKLRGKLGTFTTVMFSLVSMLPTLVGNGPLIEIHDTQPLVNVTVQVVQNTATVINQTSVK